ncbi:transposase, mutator-like family protein [Leptospira broomii serovar Hurstbridge str. 5399]|uniref:Transposase, mutator-like family protein n=1 Tax=Leptospira broomii serovar Hurstbridge str. 5399 TaxID=1049789 RepID=T0F0N0_9LEPT|nr:transposase, mutator-like family protein [Leptospira broomii serovar Hurstbridge str. 5399]
MNSVRGPIEETLNALLDEKADKLCQVSKYERNPDRVDTRAGSYNRNFETEAGKVKLQSGEAGFLGDRLKFLNLEQFRSSLRSSKDTNVQRVL